MKKEIPYNKIIRLALITSVLFGLFGATPVFEFERKDFRHIGIAFLIVCVITLFLWLINTGLLWAGQKIVLFKYNWFRYLLSVIFSGIIIVLLSEFFLPEILPSFQKRHENVRALPEMQQQALGTERQGTEPFHRMPPPRHHIFFPFLQVLSLNIFIIVLLEMVLLKNTKIKIENENNLLRMANLQAKHDQLKQQLQPHFLFNSLNVLKTLIKKFPQQAEDYLEKLSDLLRFSITSNAQTQIPLQQELELVTNYLLMQQVRFGNAIKFDIDIPGDFKMDVSNKVPVYSLQLLVENAIKHNALTIENPLNICITAQPEENTVTVSNNLQKKSMMQESNGVGLANLCERYKLIGNHNVLIQKTDAAFTVIIKTIKDESSYS